MAVRVPADLLERLKDAAAADRRRLSEWCRLALVDAVEAATARPSAR